MATELNLYEGVKIRNDLIGAHASMIVWLWDIGPEEPALPEPPEPPSGKDGEPKFDLAKIGYKRQLKAYEAGLEKFERDTVEFTAWHRKNKGPVEFYQYSVDARDTFKYDANAVAEQRQTKLRYHLSSRTRGSEKLPNGGLPKGMRPGQGHQENLDRQIAGEKEFVKALKADPVFGQEVA